MRDILIRYMKRFTDLRESDLEVIAADVRIEEFKEYTLNLSGFSNELF